MLHQQGNLLDILNLGLIAINKSLYIGKENLF